MSDAWTVLLKGVAGGSLVLAFSVLSAILEPKRFAGVFSAAPAVAIAGLTIALVTKGASDAHQSAAGMLAGCLGMLCYALAVVRLLRSGGALTSATVGLLAWIMPTAALAVVLL
ncbi:MAG: DUF3147 family protein [Solirubrobacteraceae bacterium]